MARRPGNRPLRLGEVAREGLDELREDGDDRALAHRRGLAGHAGVRVDVDLVARHRDRDVAGGVALAALLACVFALIWAVVPEVETISTGPVKTMPIEPILTVISAVAFVGLSVAMTLAPGTQGMSLLRSLIAAQLAWPLGTENDSLRTGMCVSLCPGLNVAAVPPATSLERGQGAAHGAAESKPRCSAWSMPGRPPGDPAQRRPWLQGFPRTRSARRAPLRARSMRSRQLRPGAHAPGRSARDCRIQSRHGDSGRELQAGTGQRHSQSEDRPPRCGGQGRTRPRHRGQVVGGDAGRRRRSSEQRRADGRPDVAARPRGRRRHAGAGRRRQGRHPQDDRQGRPQEEGHLLQLVERAERRRRPGGLRATSRWAARASP